MFPILLLALIVAICVHYSKSEARTPSRLGELALVYLLVGYCGIPMLLVSIGILVRPAEMAAMFGVSGGGQIQAFFGWAYLGMSVSAVMALRYRGGFLVGPAVVWAIYFAGATVVHLWGEGSHGTLGHGGIIAVLLAHTLIAVLLLVALGLSGLLRTAPSAANLRRPRG